MLKRCPGACHGSRPWLPEAVSLSKTPGCAAHSRRAAVSQHPGGGEALEVGRQLKAAGAAKIIDDAARRHGGAALAFSNTFLAQSSSYLLTYSLTSSLTDLLTSSLT